MSESSSVRDRAAPMRPAGALSPVYSFMKNPTLVDYPGKLAVMLFLSGCNFRCGFCHNAGLMAERRDGLPWSRLQSACTEFAANWVDAAVISGGEPTLHPQIEDLIAFLRGRGWGVKLDTNGSRPDVLERVLPAVDYVAMDVKAGFSRYGELTGAADTHGVRRSIELIKTRARDHEFRTTVIDGFHDAEQMREIAAAVSGAKRWILQPFVPRDDLPDPRLRRTPRTSRETLEAYRDELRPVAGPVAVRGDDLLET